VRKLMWFTIGFGTASAYGIFCNNSWLLQTAAAFALLAFICLALRRWKIHFRIGCAICLGIAVGLSVFNVFDTTVLENARTLDGRMETVTIETTDYSYATDRGCAVDGNLELRGYSYKVRVYLNEEVQLQPGCKLEGDFSFRMTFKSTDVSLNNAGKGIFLFANQNGALSIVEPTQHKWTDYPAIWRQQLKDKINAAFPEDTEGFARALLLGDTGDLDYGQDVALRVTGIRHIVATSGLHISILFSLIYLLSGKMRSFTALLGIPALILFAFVAGLSPSILRATVMQITMILAMLLRREYDPPSAFALSVIVILLLRPFAVMTASFQLSCGCVSGIFLFVPRMQAYIHRKIPGKTRGARTVRAILGGVAVTISTMVVTAPLCALYFGNISLIGVLTNLLTLWAVSVVFYGIVIALLLSFIWLPLGSAIAWLCAPLIYYVLSVANVLQNVPFAAVYTVSPYISVWLVGCYAAFAVFWLRGRQHHGIMAVSMSALLMAAVIFSYIEPRLDDYRVTVLDVGQGQCILLQSRGATYMVDCGGSSDKNVVETAASRLLSQGVSQIDGLILTHYDRDHAGGLPYFLERIRVEKLYLPVTQGEIPLKLPEKQTVSFVKENTVLPIGIGKCPSRIKQPYLGVGKFGFCHVCKRFNAGGNGGFVVLPIVAATKQYDIGHFGALCRT